MIEKCNCTGFAVCHDICPVEAVKMEFDKEGFQYPRIDSSLCISCGACDRVCPVDKTYADGLHEVKVYAAKSREKCTQMCSASGGVFPEIARVILQRKGIVWGADFDTNFDVCHTYVKDCNHLAALCRSKYVQSNMLGVYKTIKEQLKDGQTVLFTGTPCQTSGLARFVGNKLKSNLFLVDIICHGVPSIMIWREFIRELCDYNGENVKNISSIAFKYKDTIRKWNHPGFRVVWKSGQEYIDYSNMSWYENGYLSNLYVRPSCHTCKFKNLNSPSDLTIGDFWGCADVLPEMYDEDGVSVVFSKTEKGKEILTWIQNNADYIQIPYEIAVKYNSRIIKPTPVNKNRNKFWKYYLGHKEKTMEDMELIVKKCTNKSIYDHIREKIGYLKRDLWGKLR